MATLPTTAADFLELFYNLPESERASVIKRIEASNSEFDDQKFTETYKGIDIEVLRSEREEEIHGAICWVAAFIRGDGKRIIEGGVFTSFEEALEAVRAGITWEIEQDEISGSFEKAIKDFKEKGYTQSNILIGLGDALRATLPDSDWGNDLINQIEESIRGAKKSECLST